MGYDLLLKNGNIITMDTTLPRTEWVGVKDGIIAATGNSEHVPESAKKIIDLKGKTVLPGLIDSHVHVMLSGLYLNAVNLENAKSIDEILRMMEEACKGQENDTWVFGVGLLVPNIKEGRFPTKWELDRVSGKHPVAIFAATLHGCGVNSKGLEYADVPLDTPGVEIENGEVIGTFLSDESSFLATANIMGKLSDEALLGFIQDCTKHASSKGVTTIHGLYGQFVKGDKDLHLSLTNEKSFPVDIVTFYQTWNIEDVKKLNLPRIGGCLTLDGALFENTMAMFEPYLDRPELRGILYHTDEEVYQLASQANSEGIQCAMHAVGERAIDQLIYAYDRVIKEQGDKGLRHRIEHFCQPTPRHIEMAAELGIILSMQPGFTYLWDRSEGGPFEMAIGRERADQMDPFNKIIEKGCMVCGGSDSPVTKIEPLVDIAACVNNPNPVRNISLTDAIKMFTINGAYAGHLEETKGSIEVKKDADMVVIDCDPYNLENNIYDMNVEMTIKGGSVVYEK